MFKKLKPCFCGEKKLVRLLSTVQTKDEEYWVECGVCGRHTKKYLIKNMAKRQWNLGNVFLTIHNPC